MTLLCLLFQQAAMAAYACTMSRMPPDPIAMSEDCASMGMQQVREAPALCAKHCAPDQSVAPDHSTPSVPTLALPPAIFALAVATTSGSTMRATRVPVDRSDPPPRLRYCSLLI